MSTESMPLSKSKIKSVYKQYLLYTFIFPIALLSITVIIGLFNYQTIQQERHERYGIEANKVASSLTDTFQYMENFFRFIGGKIADSGSNEPSIIAGILKNKVQVDKIKEDVSSWSMFDFMNPDGFTVAASTTGVITTSVKIDKHKREWMETSPKRPWTLQFSYPDKGLVSGEWVIPSGYGITDRNGRFLGILSIGFNIDKITRKIQRSLAAGTDFVLLTDDYKIVATSSDKNDLANDIFERELAAVKFLPEKHAGMLPRSIEYGDTVFNYYRSAAPYPYIILVGDNKNVMAKEFRQTVLPQVIQTVMMGGFFLLLLYFFCTKIVSPVIRLSDSAFALSEGKTDVEIPKGNSIEADNLAGALEKVKSLLISELGFKKTLTSAHHEVKIANESLEQKVIERTAELQKALAVKSEILNNVSHEIRSPLQGVAGISENLYDSWERLSDEKRFEGIKEIKECSDRLLSFVSNVLDFSKLKEKKIELDMQPHDLSQLVRAMIDESQALTVGKNITLRYDAQQMASAIVYVDYAMMRRVLGNLLTNAIKYTDHGHITAAVNVIAPPENPGSSMVHLTLHDDGIGIPEDQLTEIFEPFTQSSLTKNSAGGTGLGLSIAKEIILSHQGNIWAENNKDKGAVFHMTLPVKQGQVPANETQSPLLKHPLRVVAIDDESHCLLNMSLLLESGGHQVVTMQGGCAGIEYLTAHPADVDVVLLDLMMPDKSGIEVLTEMRQHPVLKDVAVVLQTGASNEDEINLAFSLGIASCVRKPYQKATLISAVEGACQVKAKAS